MRYQAIGANPLNKSPEGSKLFEGYILSYLYFVISCRRGIAHLNNLDIEGANIFKALLNNCCSE